MTTKPAQLPTDVAKSDEQRESFTEHVFLNFKVRIPRPIPSRIN